MNMKNRSYKILSILRNSDKYITAEALSASCLVSTKTILKDIKLLNEEMNSSRNYIEVVPSHGVKLIINDFKQFQSFYSSFDKTTHTILEREEWIEKYLIGINTWVKSEDLCEQLYISPSGLSQNIKEVRKMLAKYDLKIIQKPHYGIKVDGREFNKRLCLGQIYITHIDQREDFPGSQFAQDELVTIYKINDIVDQVLTTYQISMSEVSFQNLVIDIFVSLQRIQRGIILRTTDTMILDVSRWSASVAAVEIAQQLQKNFCIEMKDQEIAGLSVHIASKRIIRHFDENIHRIIEDYDVNRIVDHMLKSIKRKWGIDFSKDHDLISRLQLHLIPLEVRSRYNVTLQNPLLNEIKEHNILAYQLAKTGCEQLKDYHGNSLAEEEIGYFALHFNLALLALKMKTKKNVLVVSGLGRGTAHTVAYQLQELFGKYISSIQTTDYIELRKYDLAGIDLLISSIPLKRSYPIPMIEVHYFVNEDDKKNVEMRLNDRMPFHMMKYMQKEMFFTDISAKTKEEAVSYLAHQISDQKDVYQELIESDCAGSAELDHMVGLLSIKVKTGKTRLLVGILNKPIVWNERRVQIILLPVIGEMQYTEMQNFYEELSALVLNPEYIKRIIRTKNFEEISSIFEAIESIQG
jgi:transcriptional antiterminator